MSCYAAVNLRKILYVADSIDIYRSRMALVGANAGGVNAAKIMDTMEVIE